MPLTRRQARAAQDGAPPTGPNQNACSTLSQQNTVTESPATDRLSALPPELLTLIFELADLPEEDSEESPPFLGGLSKTLLPYQTVFLYRQASFNKWNRFELFLRTIVPEGNVTDEAKRRGEQLGRLVRKLEIQTLPTTLDFFPCDFGTRQVLALFGALDNLRELGLGYEPILLEVLTSNVSARGIMPHLRNLLIELPIGELQDEQGEAFVVERFNWLANYPKLDLLQVMTTHDSEYNFPFLTATPDQLQFSLTTFNLYKLHRGLPSQDVVTLLSYCPHLSLARIIVFFAAGKQGPDFSHLSEIPASAEEVGWELPEWEDGFNVRQALNLVKKGVAVGVDVDGDIREALYTQMMWQNGVEAIEQRMEASGGW